MAASSDKPNITPTAAGKAAPAPGAPAAPVQAAYSDMLLAAVHAALDPIAALDPTVQSLKIIHNINQLLVDQTPAALQTVPTDVCAAPVNPMTQFCLKLALDNATAQSKLTSDTVAAAAAWHGEAGAWSHAINQYKFALGSAQVTLEGQVKTASDAYTAKFNKDSQSRNNYLFFTMKEAIAAAIQAYLVSAQVAALALIGEGSNLLTAYATYFAQMSQAQALMLVGQATADQTFWQGLEQTLDAI